MHVCGYPSPIKDPESSACLPPPCPTVPATGHYPRLDEPDFRHGLRTV
jgi:hypothetical protein